MRGGRFVTTLTLLAACTALLLGGCGPSKKRIVILTNGTSPFWDAAKRGALDASEEFKLDEAGYEVVVDTNDFKVEGQITKLKGYANSSDVVAVGISVTDASNQAIADEMAKLRAAGIKVLAIDSDVAPEHAEKARFAYLGTNNVKGGQELGKAAKGLRPQGGRYAAFVGLKSAANAKERTSGFAEGAGDKFTQGKYLGDMGDANEARKSVIDALEDPEITTLVGIWSYNTPAIVDVVGKQPDPTRFTVVGFDAEPNAITHMAEGKVHAMVVQNPYEMGYQGVRLLKALVVDDQETIKEMLPSHGQPGGDIYDTGLKVVVPDEGSPLIKEMFDPKTEFLKLSEFQAWLKKYNLTGS